jgi:hypothetical protein
MTVWELLNNNIPLWFATPAFILIAVGFCLRGITFFKFGFGKLPNIPLNVATKADIERIETNHFAHLNKFFDLFCSILRDKAILTNEQSTQLKQTLKG